jgi:hypothetical protein
VNGIGPIVRFAIDARRAGVRAAGQMARRRWRRFFGSSPPRRNPRR